MASIYSKIESAKNGTLIPVLLNGKSLESKYNPEREAESLLDSLGSESFYIITGIMSGIFIKLLSERKPEAKILCIEQTPEDIHFLYQIPLVKELSKNPNIIYSSLENITENIINNYLPAKYGEYKIIERRSWLQENSNIIPLIQQNITKAIGIISADYSVQVHFGKIWQKNILDNLCSLSNLKNNIQNTIDISKTAYVIAAGPSLDCKINEIKNNPDSYIISTDTAYSTLLKNNIIPDAVISIDGQNISTNHFIHIDSSKTTFYFDLCSNSSAAKHILEENGKVIFFKSGHPFCALANIHSNNSIPNLFTGSGTVTIAATDLAISLGFQTIKVLGADFGYINGKPYTKGTYFDTIYNLNTNKIKSNETNFDILMFRTELLQNNSKLTTKILSAYEQSFEEYISSNKLPFIKNGTEYTITNKRIQKKDFITNCKFSINSFKDFINNCNKTDLETALLPLIAWFRNQNESDTFDNLVKLAYNYILSYNYFYE